MTITALLIVTPTYMIGTISVILVIALVHYMALHAPIAPIITHLAVIRIAGATVGLSVYVVVVAVV